MYEQSLILGAEREYAAQKEGAERLVIALLKSGATLPASQDVLKMMVGIYEGDPSLQMPLVCAQYIHVIATGLQALLVLCMAKERM